MRRSEGEKKEEEKRRREEKEEGKRGKREEEKNGRGVGMYSERRLRDMERREEEKKGRGGGKRRKNAGEKGRTENIRGGKGKWKRR